MLLFLCRLFSNFSGWFLFGNFFIGESFEFSKFQLHKFIPLQNKTIIPIGNTTKWSRGYGFRPSVPVADSAITLFVMERF